jgi:hypothetical protein
VCGAGLGSLGAVLNLVFAAILKKVSSFYRWGRRWPEVVLDTIAQLQHAPWQQGVLSNSYSTQSLPVRKEQKESSRYLVSPLVLAAHMCVLHNKMLVYTACTWQRRDLNPVVLCSGAVFSSSPDSPRVAVWVSLFLQWRYFFSSLCVAMLNAKAPSQPHLALNSTLTSWESSTGQFPGEQVAVMGWAMAASLGKSGDQQCLKDSLPPHKSHSRHFREQNYSQIGDNNWGLQT